MITADNSINLTVNSKPIVKVIKELNVGDIIVSYECTYNFDKIDPKHHELILDIICK